MKRGSSSSVTARRNGTARAASRAYRATARSPQPVASRSALWPYVLHAKESTRSIRATRDERGRRGPDRRRPLASRLRNGLRERNYGVFEGHSFAGVESAFRKNSRNSVPATRTTFRPRERAPRSSRSHRHGARDRRRAGEGTARRRGHHGGVLGAMYRHAMNIPLEAKRGYSSPTRASIISASPTGAGCSMPGATSRICRGKPGRAVNPKSRA